MFLSIRKADILLFIFFLAAAAAIAAAPLVRQPARDAEKVQIICRGEKYGEYPLGKDTVVRIAQEGCTNIVSIQDKTVHMDYSSCKNQVCVNTGTISHPGELIVCLPNQIVVEILSSETEGGVTDAESIDAVVK